MDTVFNVVRCHYDGERYEKILQKTHQGDVADVIKGLKDSWNSRAEIKEWKKNISGNGSVMLSEMVLSTFDGEDLDIKARKLLGELRASSARLKSGHEDLRRNAEQSDIFMDAKEYQENSPVRDGLFVEGTESEKNKDLEKEKELIDGERIEREKTDKYRIEREAIERERSEQRKAEISGAQQELIQKEEELHNKEGLDNDRQKKESIANEILDKEQGEKELHGKERPDKERQDKEWQDKEWQEKEMMMMKRMEMARMELARMEMERQMKEKREKEKVKKARIDNRKILNDRQEKKKMDRESAEQGRMEKERVEKERIEKERIEKERIEKERIEKERIEKERIHLQKGNETFQNEEAARMENEKNQTEHPKPQEDQNLKSHISKSPEASKNEMSNDKVAQDPRKNRRRSDWLEQGESLDETESQKLRAIYERKRKEQLLREKIEREKLEKEAEAKKVKERIRRDSIEKQSEMERIQSLRTARMARERTTNADVETGNLLPLKNRLAEFTRCGDSLIDVLNRGSFKVSGQESFKRQRIYMYDLMIRVFNGLDTVCGYEVSAEEINRITIEYLDLMIRVYSDVRVIEQVAILEAQADNSTWGGNLQSDMHWLAVLSQRAKVAVENGEPLQNNPDKIFSINVCEKDLIILRNIKKRLQILMTTRAEIYTKEKNVMRDFTRVESKLHEPVMDTERKLVANCVDNNETTVLDLSKLCILEQHLQAKIDSGKRIGELYLIDEKIADTRAEVGIKVNTMLEGLRQDEEALEGFKSQLKQVRDQIRFLRGEVVLSQSTLLDEEHSENERNAVNETAQQELSEAQRKLETEAVKRENELKMKRIADQEAESRRRALKMKRKMQNKNVVRSDLDPRLKRMRR